MVAVGEKPYAETPGDDDTPVLAPAQARLIDDLQATGKTVIVVVVAGRPLVMNRQLDRADAALMAFLPGTEGGGAIADVLLGDYNPSGRLSVSWQRSVNQFPLAYNEPGAYNPRYAFGHGRSYTKFAVKSLDGPRAVRQGQTARFDVRVANTGQRRRRPHAARVRAAGVRRGPRRAGGLPAHVGAPRPPLVRADRRRLDPARAGRLPDRGGRAEPEAGGALTGGAAGAAYRDFRRIVVWCSGPRSPVGACPRK